MRIVAPVAVFVSLVAVLLPIACLARTVHALRVAPTQPVRSLRRSMCCGWGFDGPAVRNATRHCLLESSNDAAYGLMLIGGCLLFKGKRYPLHDADPKARETAVQELAYELEGLVDEAPETLTRSHVNVWAAPVEPWQDVALAIRLLLHPKRAPGRILLVADQGATYMERALAAHCTKHNGDLETGPLTFVLGAVYREGTPTVYVSVGEQAWRVPGRLDDDGSTLASAHAWDEIDAWLGAHAEGLDTVRIGALPPAPVPWQAVASLLDVLVGRGILKVQLPDAGVDLTFEPPVPDRHHETWIDRRSPLSPRTVPLSLAALLLAIAATVPLWRWRR